LEIDWRKIITVEPGKRGGKPCIRGLRITVQDVLEYLAGGMSPDEILADFPWSGSRNGVASFSRPEGLNVNSSGCNPEATRRRNRVRETVEPRLGSTAPRLFRRTVGSPSYRPELFTFVPLGPGQTGYSVFQSYFTQASPRSTNASA
jgi:hypothetical protein